MHMKHLVTALVTLSISGCVIYLEHPEDQLVAGDVFWESGEAVANANVTVWEGRSFFTLLPISYPYAAKTVTDEKGHFEVVVKNSWPAEIAASVECGFGSVEVKENEISKVTIRVTKTCS